MSKAWPEEKVVARDARVWPKNLIEKTVEDTMEKSINSLLQETFPSQEEKILKKLDEPIVEPIVEPIAVPEFQKKTRTIKIESKVNDKYVWISLGILFFLGFCAYNSLIYKLGIIETLISRRKSVMALK